MRYAWAVFLHLFVNWFPTTIYQKVARIQSTLLLYNRSFGLKVHTKQLNAMEKLNSFKYVNLGTTLIFLLMSSLISGVGRYVLMCIGGIFILISFANFARYGYRGFKTKIGYTIARYIIALLVLIIPGLQFAFLITNPDKEYFSGYSIICFFALVIYLLLYKPSGCSKAKKTMKCFGYLLILANVNALQSVRKTSGNFPGYVDEMMLTVIYIALFIGISLLVIACRTPKLHDEPMRENSNYAEGTIVPHIKIFRYTWISFGMILGIAGILECFDVIFPDFQRPEYRDYGNYYPFGDYGSLRIGDIINHRGYIKGAEPAEHDVSFMGLEWDKTDAEGWLTQYGTRLESFVNYDSNQESEAYGHFTGLMVYDLSELIKENGDEESKAYERIISSEVSDTTIYKRSEHFSPVLAVETPVYDFLTRDENDEWISYAVKHIVLFANSRAYHMSFWVLNDSTKNGANTFEMLEARSIMLSKRLDLHSYDEWIAGTKNYIHTLTVQSWIFAGLYLLCIASAVLFSFLYYINSGKENKKAAKFCRIVSLFGIASCIILGISLFAEYGTICDYPYYNYYGIDYYINNHDASESICLYAFYFLFIIVVANIAYVKSYTVPKTSSSPKGYIYYMVRPMVIIMNLAKKSKVFINSVRQEYNRQAKEIDEKSHNSK